MIRKKILYIIITALVLIGISCNNEKKKDALNSNGQIDLETSAGESYNELEHPENEETLTISEYNTDSSEIENIERPEKTIIQNVTIDTTKAFGIWTQDPDGPHADFWLTKDSFYVVDYDGDGAIPYILDKDEITIFYNDFIQKGVITSTENDTLKIKWSDVDQATVYVKFEN